MPALSLWTGLILVLLGIVAYTTSGGASLTALIPSAFGLVLATLGLAGRKPSARRHTMHAAAVVALLGFLGSAAGIARLITLIGGGAIERPAAAIAQTVMAVLCALFLGFAVRSFVRARRGGTG